MQADDTYLTLETMSEAVFKERSSRFLAYAYPVTSLDEIRDLLDSLHKRYFDATHHCYAYRLGPNGETFRINDDREPAGTAGKPILGQILSAGLTDCLIVVVRYFGGTKLGVPGLISAYRQSAAAAIDAAVIVERTIDAEVEIVFSFLAMNDVMKIVKDVQPRILDQQFDNICRMTLAIRLSLKDNLLGRLEKVDGITINVL